MILEKPRKVFGLSRNGPRNDLTVAQVAFNMELYLGKEQLFSLEIRKSSNGLCSRYCPADATSSRSCMVKQRKEADCKFKVITLFECLRKCM